MMFVNVGCMVFQTIYYLSSPLCFTPVLVGAQLGLKFSLVALSPIVIVVLQKVLKLHQLSIVLVGLVALSSFALVMSFATTHALVFIATTITLLSNPAKPFIQAKISSLASKYEQGAVFALLSSTEVVTFLAATLSFLTLYPATLSIYHGFAWLFGAGVVLIPFLLVLTIYIADKRLGSSHQHSEDTTPILS
uniref:Major facilitator superfamily (MFS) profile domain-containing protein n=1 Tax=Ciona savignyi TaxID=51511 RepID=H2Y9R1_CIOSA